MFSMSCQPIDNTHHEDITIEDTLRENITIEDVRNLKAGMAVREVMKTMGLPEAASIHLPFISYLASDRNDGYRYILYLHYRKGEQELWDMKIIGAESALSPWTFDQPSERIWTSEEWEKNRNSKDANKAVVTTPGLPPPPS